MQKINKLEVILKLTEVCNIDCTYCYFFADTNTDFESKPRQISAKTVAEVATFLASTCSAHEIEYLQIDLHGGEPLMLGKSKFKAMLQKLRSTLDPVVHLVFAMQTNAILLDEEWIDLLVSFGVQTSISLDGPRDVNDRERIDKKGRGTYDRTVRGLRLLQERAASNQGVLGGVICVARPDADGRAVYRHFADELGFKRMHFLLPDFTRDSITSEGVEPYTRFVLAALDEWVQDGPRGVHVRLFNNMLAGILERGISWDSDYVYRVLTIRSDGALDPDDDLRNAVPRLFGLGYRASEHSYAQFIADPAIANLYEQIRRPSRACGNCQMLNVCQSGISFGQPEHRYSFATKFDNAPIFCETYKTAIRTLAEWCNAKGVAPRLTSRYLSTSTAEAYA